jgi:lipopolysaccharide/colanic/teichoic acid biosynthesis glycosyltransferase
MKHNPVYMEMLFLPQTVKSEKKSKASFTFRSYPVKDVYCPVYSGFYYIGKDAGHIQMLLDFYQRGYATEDFDNAKSELLRSVEQNDNILPQFILIGAVADLETTKVFCRFLRKHPLLSSIPLLIEGSALSADKYVIYKSKIRPDEILSIAKAGRVEFCRKVDFLRKIKQHAPNRTSNKIERSKIERSKPVNLDLALMSKRVFDMVLAGLVLLLLSPLFLLIAIAIKIESRGPVFYISKRAGRGYKIFDFYKFRTMKQDADKKIDELIHLNQYGADVSNNMKGPVFFKISNDPRITRIGGLLRNTSLDELPQLFNVLLGDMSLVGNRPLPLYEARTLTTDEYAARFMAPAGITGLWQVKKRGNKNMSVEERISMDIDYASKVSFKTDFWIIASTPSALIQKENV